MAATMLRQLIRSEALEDFPGPFAERARQAAESLRDVWNRTSRDAAANRQLETLHESRDGYRELLEGHLRLLEEYFALAKLHRRAFGANPVWEEELRRAVATLRELHDRLFPRWQTVQDLAQILVEQLSLPADALNALAAKSHPPATWFEETADPFTD